MDDNDNNINSAAPHQAEVNQDQKQTPPPQPDVPADDDEYDPDVENNLEDPADGEDFDESMPTVTEEEDPQPDL